MRFIASGISDFETLISNHYLYVDKTEYLWKLIQRVGEAVFLSRPRRFGKSLTLSTLKAIFLGKRFLFQGLALDQKDYDWKTYPVIHLDLGDFRGHCAEAVEEFLSQKLQMIAREQDITLMAGGCSFQLEQLIWELSKQAPVVILIDEYDKPILENIGQAEIQEILGVLKSFYSVIKARGAYLHYVFVTGVSKFSHVSIFSGFNNLRDISMNEGFATMLGYTQEELETNFPDEIGEACQIHRIQKSEMLKKIKEWYDGYRFSGGAESVYNPVSVAKFFDNGCKFGNYWFATGTPSFLMQLAREKKLNMENALKMVWPESVFESFDVEEMNPVALLLQTGYLTIKSCERKYGQWYYRLGFPNLEVGDSFTAHLLNAYTNKSKDDGIVFATELADALNAGD